MRNAPQNTFGITTTYTIPVGPGELSAYASYRYQDEIETILNNDTLGHLDGIENLDLTLSYAWDHFRVTAFGRNMTDEVYARRVRIQPLVTFGQYTQGENYGIEFSVSY
jgi:iron complex outermembrane receptor protein